jgi:signal transduction histidine kinase
MSPQNNSQKINNLKSLAGSIAHETRNPLSAIKGCCELIKDNLDQALEFLDLISVSSNRGLSIIDMTLQNIRGEEIDKTKFMDISMGAIIEGAMREYAFESKKLSSLVHVDLKDDFNFFGDETLMIFVVFNLLKNSLYYRANINIWLNGDKRCLYFKDDGSNRLKNANSVFRFDEHFFEEKISGTSRLQAEGAEKRRSVFGIPADKLEFIFDDFFTSDKKGGTGLGLPFCKRVMNAFGGDISVKSEVGKGTEFCLRF